MALILAIEPDKRQSSQLASVVKGLQAELVQRANAADGLAALQGRVPDLVLTSSLISPRDDSALAAHLRELGAAAAHVQTVTIPLLGSAAPQRARGGMLAALRREKPQAPMTDGCAPDVFAEQVHQYLTTAEEQKATAATRFAAAPAHEDLPAPVMEFVAPASEPEPELELESESESEPVVETPLAYEATETFEPIAVAPVEIVPVEEPAPVAEPVEAVAIEPVEALPEEALPEELVDATTEEFVGDEPAGLPLSQLLQLVSDRATIAAPRVTEPQPEPIAESIAEPIAELIAQPVVEELLVEAIEETAPVVELYVDPMAAQALDELSLQEPAEPIADGIPAEPPVPVVEMRAYQSLDSIASELAAGPAERHESLDALASLFAATPSPEPSHYEAALVEPAVEEFASLFAQPAPWQPAEATIEVPDIDPSLFASEPAAPIAAFEAAEAPLPETVLEAAPEPVVEVVPEPLLVEFEVPEPEPVLTAALEPELEPVFEDGPIDFEAVVFEPVVFEQAAEEPFAAGAAPAYDDEIALDVDAFAFTAPEPAAPAVPAPFSFTFVDGFGDAMNEFEVPSVASMAADLGVGEHPPLDPFAARAEAPAAGAGAGAGEPLAAPMLDEEALSLIGDAARKVSLNAFVIEEFERGVQARRLKKAKKKAHAGATQVVPPVVERPAKPVRRPVQDEWGMFDPEQAGFAALEDEEAAETRPTTTGARGRVISY